MFPWAGENTVVTADKQWEEDELAGLCKDQCYYKCNQIQQDMKQGKNVVWYDKTLLNPIDLYVAVFGNVCLCDKYDELGGLTAFETWMYDEICKKIADNKYKHYV